MSYQEDRFLEIANAIRAKDGTTAPIKATDFADRIEAIPSGGGGTGENPTLNQVSLTRADNLLTIVNPASNGNFVEGYKIYNRGVLESTQSGSSYDLFNMNAGAHQVTAKAYGTNFIDSASSNVIDYSVYAVSQNLTLMTSSNNAELVGEGQNFSTTLTVQSGKYLPRNIDVTAEDYTYNNDTGELTVYNVASNVTITAVASDYARLPIPVIELAGDVLSWGTIVGATSYLVMVNGDQLAIATGNTFELNSLTLEEGAYSIALVASGAGYQNSNESEEIMYAVGVTVLSQHAYDKMEAHIETATYHIIDPYGELDKIYTGDTLTWSKYPQNVVVFLSDEARTITPKYTQSGITLQYSIDEGSNWVTIASKTATESSKEIWFRGQATGLKSLYSSVHADNEWLFSNPHTSLRVKGNLNYLLCDILGDTDAPLAIGDYCYSSMFRNYTSLVEAPALPATSLATRCYRNMFYGCTSLIEAPALPATSLGGSCYEAMFYSCTSLVEASALPATTLMYRCYHEMFASCKSLIEAPALPATSLHSECYRNMFYGCTSLIEIKLGYTGNSSSSLSDWVTNIKTVGTLYKAGEQFDASGTSTYPTTWTQVPWTP